MGKRNMLHHLGLDPNPNIKRPVNQRHVSFDKKM